jgi:hypothetical protein
VIRAKCCGTIFQDSRWTLHNSIKLIPLVPDLQEYLAFSEELGDVTFDCSAKLDTARSRAARSSSDPGQLFCRK